MRIQKIFIVELKKTEDKQKTKEQCNRDIEHYMKFINSFRFVSNFWHQISLIIFLKTLSQKCNNCKGFLEYGKVKDNLLLCNCIIFEKYHEFSLIKYWKIDSQILTNFMMEILMNFD